MLKKDGVFLGGTCGNNNWRPGFIEDLVDSGVSREALFNPVVPEWSDAAYERETQAKKDAQYVLFHIANPMEEGRSPHSQYAIVQAVQSVFREDRETRIFFDTAFLDKPTAKRMQAIVKDINALKPDLTFENWRQFVGSVARFCAGARRRVFLGGTCGNNNWRTRFLEQLKARYIDVSDMFDPELGAGQWNVGVQKLEDQARKHCALEVYYIGDPKEARTVREQVSPYSLAEAIIALNLDLSRTVVSFDYSQWEGQALLSMKKFEADIRADFPSANIFSSLDEASDWLVNVNATKVAA